MKISDRKFFCELIDISTINKIVDIEKYIQQEDFLKCREIFAAYFRKIIKPEIFFDVIKGETFDTEKVIDKAEDACRHYMVSCGKGYDFKGKKVDWEFNPTDNGYREWPWQLNRHEEWLNLARAYRITKDKKYVDAFVELFESWLEQAIAPPVGTSGYETVCWRTIECGIRQGLKWPEIIHSFYDALPDNALVDWVKSVWEHANRLYNDNTGQHWMSNWFLMELNGLMHISIIYPFFKDSQKWFDFCMDSFMRCIDLQIYPDGAQFELTTDYQYVTILNYIKPIKLCSGYGKSVPKKMLDAVEKTLMFYVRFMRPDRKSPCINDGSFMDVKKVIKLSEGLFENNAYFKWVLGKEADEPKEKSYVFEYPGLATLRSGYGSDDSFVFFDGGVFGTGHQHEDKLSLTFFADGYQTLCEGNSYAYDDSPMRKYVRSTFAHNTGCVDGMGQNRRKDYKWDGAITEKSNLKFHLTDELDALSAVYDEGYGENADKIATHRRNVYYVKKHKNLNPFLIVCDRFDGSSEHSYEIMWHLDADSIDVKDTDVKANTLHIFVNNNSETQMEISRGKVSGKMQGWIADSTVQGDYRPIYNLSYLKKCDKARFVTLIYPDGGKECEIVCIKASDDLNNREVEICFSDGSVYKFVEPQI